MTGTTITDLLAIADARRIGTALRIVFAAAGDPCAANVATLVDDITRTRCPAAGVIALQEHRDGMTWYTIGQDAEALVTDLDRAARDGDDAGWVTRRVWRLSDALEGTPRVKVEVDWDWSTRGRVATRKVAA